MRPGADTRYALTIIAGMSGSAAAIHRDDPAVLWTFVVILVVAVIGWTISMLEELR